MAPSSPWIHLLMIGDSDIARWPKELLPSVSSRDDSGDLQQECCETAGSLPTPTSPISVSGHSGATLSQIIEPLKEGLERIAQTPRAKHRAATTVLRAPQESVVVVVVCAGENDIGDGVPLAKSEQALETSLKTVFDDFGSRLSRDFRLHMIFLGPKLEPWLKDDMHARKAYIRMSSSFERICNARDGVIFVDCLTMFCGKSANQPGSLFGGRAIPETQYFNDDQLHLSKEGYLQWKKVVEERIRAL